MKVEWSNFAEEQQSDILRYLAVEMSIADAIRWANRFHDDTELLKDQPWLGHPVRPVIFARQPLLIDRLRELFSGPYRILYETVEETIRVLSITHGTKMIDGDGLVWDK